MASREREGQDETLSLPEDPTDQEDQDTTQEGDEPEQLEESEEEAKPKLNLSVDVQERSACERHITVTIPREEITRYFDKEFSELMTTAAGEKSRSRIRSTC